MFAGNVLPKGSTDLIATLASLKVDLCIDNISFAGVEKVRFLRGVLILNRSSTRARFCSRRLQEGKQLTISRMMTVV